MHDFRRLQERRGIRFDDCSSCCLLDNFVEWRKVCSLRDRYKQMSRDVMLWVRESADRPWWSRMYATVSVACKVEQGT